jgi:hypothetical protein
MRSGKSKSSSTSIPERIIHEKTSTTEIALRSMKDLSTPRRSLSTAPAAIVAQLNAYAAR